MEFSLYKVRCNAQTTTNKKIKKKKQKINIKKTEEI